MIPAEFDYVRAESVAHATRLLADCDDAAVLAGGHSLLPMMKLRLAAPSLLVDIGSLEELRYIRRSADMVEIGAATAYVDIVTADVVRQSVPLLGRTAAAVGDPQTRYRGTIGGALAHADPVADVPTALLALDAEVVAQGVAGQRTIAVADLLVDYFTTALEPGEVITAVRVPATGAEQYWYEKFSVQAAGWALVSVAVAGTRIALAGMGPTPLRAEAAEEALAFGGDAAAASELVTAGTSPITDRHGDAAYRRDLARVLTHRALLAAQRRR